MIALKAIEQLRAPPIPPAILAELHQDYIVFQESFTVYGKGNPNPIQTPSNERWQLLKP